MTTQSNPIDDYAAMSLRRWRKASHTDEEILDMVNQHTDADDVWEAAQLVNPGHVYAPPAAVKARIRRLLTH